MKTFIRAHRCFDLVVESHNNFVAFNTALERAIRELQILSKETGKLEDKAEKDETPEKRNARQAQEKHDRRERLDQIDGLTKSLVEVQKVVEKARVRDYLANSIKLVRAVEIQEK